MTTDPPGPDDNPIDLPGRTVGRVAGAFFEDLVHSVRDGSKSEHGAANELASEYQLDTRDALALIAAAL